MVVSFYTSRIILKNLGVSDFGLYNVVAGFITMFGFIQGSMANGVQRFMSYTIKIPDEYDVETIFRASMRILAILSFGILILAETIGVWFLYNKMTIPIERIDAALWVFQLSLLQLIVLLLSVPYTAMIVAYERMGAFADISILEAACKLSIAFLLGIVSADKLILYAILMFSVQLLIRIVYTSYCNQKISKMTFKGKCDSAIIRKLLGYIGWNTTSLCSEVVQVQGINILLNLFFGPIVNAARGIAMQVMGVIRNFSVNFLMATNPQIIKSFASGDIAYTKSLIFKSSRFGFILMFCISSPIMLITDDLLEIWLTEVPSSTGDFVRLIICATIISITADPVKTAISATGQVKHINIWMSVILLSVIPLSYLSLEKGYDGRIVFIIQSIANSLILLVSLCFLRKHIGISKTEYGKNVLTRISAIILSVALFAFTIKTLLPNTFTFRLLEAICVFLTSIIISFLLGITSKERNFIIQLIKKRLIRF